MGITFGLYSSSIVSLPTSMSSKYRRVFKDNEKLEKLLLLRQEGTSIKKLANIFGVDRTVIRFHLTKNGVSPLIPIITVNQSKPKSSRRRDEYGDFINEGHDYAYYLALNSPYRDYPSKT